MKAFVLCRYDAIGNIQEALSVPTGRMVDTLDNNPQYTSVETEPGSGEYVDVFSGYGDGIPVQVAEMSGGMCNIGTIYDVEIIDEVEIRTPVWVIGLISSVTAGIDAAVALPNVYELVRGIESPKAWMLDVAIPEAKRTQFNNWLSNRGLPTIPSGYTIRQVLKHVIARFGRENFEVGLDDVRDYAAA